MTRNKHNVKAVAKKLPLVSIIVPTYNRSWILPRAIESLVNQSYENLEIIVINDAGEDVSSIVNSFSDPRIKYYQNEKNLGLAGSRNVGLTYSTGDYICLLDDDDVYLKYAIEFRLYMMDRLKADIVYTRALQDVWKTVNEQEHKFQRVIQRLYWDSPFNKDLILVQNIAPCCNVLFSREAWRKSGYYKFDQQMTTTEDHDFWIALSRESYFHELKIIDTECSMREGDKNQMSGNLNFVPNWIITFKRWRHTALDLEYVTKSQRDILNRVGVNPTEHGL